MPVASSATELGTANNRGPRVRASAIVRQNSGGAFSKTAVAFPIERRSVSGDINPRR
jgi:hypothetical protein